MTAVVIGPVLTWAEIINFILHKDHLLPAI